MRRVQRQQGEAGGHESVQAPGRRTFLGVGIGCAAPILFGNGILGATSLLASSRAAGATDPVWDHIASEAWGICRAVHGSRGASGEHVRRLASGIDLFAVHLRGSGVEPLIDGDVRQRVREQGRESVALELVSRYRDAIERRAGAAGHAAGLVPEPGRVSRCLDELVSVGMVKSLRSRRPSLEREAARLDRDMLARSGMARPANLPGQKPGDDFLGYPEVPPPDLCELLQFIVVACTVATAVLAAAGQLEALPAIQGLQAACEALLFACCQNRATCAD